MGTSTITVEECDDGSIKVTIDGSLRGHYDSTQELAMFLGLCLCRIEDLEGMLSIHSNAQVNR